MKVVLVLFALVASVFVAPSAFAWSSPICNPANGEVRSPESFKNGPNGTVLTDVEADTAYNRYLHDHAGSFPMGAGETCHKPAPTPVPTPDMTPTPPPTAVATPIPAPPAPPETAATPAATPSPSAAPQPPMPGAGQLVAICHYEPTTGNLERRNVQPDQVQKRLDLGDTLMVPRAVCTPPTPLEIPAITPGPVVFVPAPTAPPVAVATVAVPDVAQPLPDSTPVPQAETPLTEDVPFAPPPLGDGSAADELVP